MKLIHSFAAFLDDHVNLNKTRVDQAESAFQALTSFLGNADDTRDHFIDTFRQGSLRQGTIIRPRTEETEFDVDLMVRLKPVDRWSATDYLDAVHSAFKASERYKEIVDRRGKHRCVTIDYATNDFHVDVVPSIEVAGNCWIMNRSTGAFEQTDGDGYAKWFQGRGEIVGGKKLMHAVRLVKFLRDEHSWDVKSILLTTMVGLRVSASDSAATFPDLPTTLHVLMTRLDAWLQSQEQMPMVSNPALAAENFVRHWDEPTFRSFKRAFHGVASNVTAAFTEPHLEASVELWRKAFGDRFEVSDEDTEDRAVALSSLPPMGALNHVQPVANIARSENLQYRVRVAAKMYNASGKTFFRDYRPGMIVPSGRSLRFEAWTDAPGPYSVHWQVVNTGSHAQHENGLRGGFFQGHKLDGSAAPISTNWEKTAYTGRHWVECFIVKNGICVGRSGRINVNIKNPAH